MHDGSLLTLADVIDFYDKGGSTNPRLDLELRPLHLTAPEKAALVPSSMPWMDLDKQTSFAPARLLPQHGRW